MDWTLIEDYLKRNTDESLALALLEYDKSLTRELSSRGSHKDFQEMLGGAKFISNLTEVSKARNVLEKIVAIPGFKIDRKELEEAINAYHLALVDTLAAEGKPSIYDKIFLALKQFIFTAKGMRFKKILLGVVLLFAFIYFLSGTSVGKSFGEGIVSNINAAAIFLVSALAVFAATVIVAAIALLFFDRLRRGQTIGKEKES